MTMTTLNFAKNALLILAVVSMTACGAGRESALAMSDAEMLTGKAQGDFQSKVAEGDAAWEGRMERAQLETAIGAWEAATNIATPDLSEDERRAALAQVYSKLSRAYYFLADAHVRLSAEDEDDVEEDLKRIFEKGATAAELGLGIYSKDYAAAIRYETSIPEAIKVLDNGATPLLYWYATNIGKWALLEGFIEILSRKDNIKAIMDKVEAENPTYLHGAAYRYLGAYYTKLPFPGGDIEKSTAYFKKAIAADSSWLSSRVLYAKMNATKADNKQLFRDQLQLVVDFDLTAAPEIAAENHFEQLKAKRLLANIDDLF
jgi:hypothetical protein